MSVTIRQAGNEWLIETMESRSGRLARKQKRKCLQTSGLPN